MSLSDCDHCWETPCVCADARGYRHLSSAELVCIRDGINRIIEERIMAGTPATDDRRPQPGGKM